MNKIIPFPFRLLFFCKKVFQREKRILRQLIAFILEKCNEKSKFIKK